MRETNTSSKIKVKQFLAWILSLQIAGVAYVVPAYFFLSNVAYAGTETTNVAPQAPVDLPPQSEAEKSPRGAYMQQYPKESHSGVAPEKSKRQPICQEADGTIKRGCKIAAVLLGVVGVIALILLTRKKGKKKGFNMPVPGKKPGRPTERPRPERPGKPGGPGRPPVVPCCQNPAPAPAPEGGGVTENSNITTGNTLPPGITPVVVNPTE